MRIKPLILSVVGVLFFSGIATAQFPSAGSVNYPYLLLPYDARSAALGGAGSALPGSLELITVNPAAAASVKSDMAFIGYHNLGMDVWGSLLSYSRVFEFGVMTFSLIGLSSGDVDVMGILGDNPLPTDDVAHDECFTPSVSLSRAFLDGRLFVGATAKGMYQRIDAPPDVYSSKAFGFDLGVQYKPVNNRFVAAVVLRNIGYEFDSFTDDDRYPVPMVFDAGVTYIPRYFPSLRVVADVNKTRGSDLMYEPGLEIEAYPDVLTFRVAYPFSQTDLEKQLDSFSGDKDESYTKNNYTVLSCGAGVKTDVGKRAVSFDIAIQFKNEIDLPTVVLSALVDL